MIRTIVIATALVLATTAISNAATKNKILSNPVHAKYKKDNFSFGSSLQYPPQDDQRASFSFVVVTSSHPPR